MIALNTFGQLMFKSAAISLKDKSEFTIILKTLITTLPFWFALCFYAAAVFFWIWLLRSTPLSIAYSATGIIFIFVPIASFFFFNEILPMRFWLGASLIGIGVWLTYSS